MREILFRGKAYSDKWVEGCLITVPNYDYFCILEDEDKLHPVDFPYLDDLGTFDGRATTINPETIGQFTGLLDKNGKKIFEGDIVQYNTYDDFDCQSVVNFGEYIQDGSGGEYSGRKCVGYYVEVDNFTCPDWADDDPEFFPYYMWQQNLLEVANECVVIGNIFDNPEILSK